jgi:hypothetical protein
MAELNRVKGLYKHVSKKQKRVSRRAHCLETGQVGEEVAANQIRS